MSTLDKFLKQQGPNEIKHSLIDWSQKFLSHGNTDIFIDELCFVDRSRRADLVLANGSLSAFEIKSKQDTLSRWLGQQEAYLSCFEKVWLCVHVKHLEAALKQCDSDVGLLVIDDLSGISMIKSAANSSKLDPYSLTGFLWRSELDLLAKENELEVKSRMKIKEVRQVVAEELPVSKIISKVLFVLKERYSSKSSNLPVGELTGLCK